MAAPDAMPRPAGAKLEPMPLAYVGLGANLPSRAGPPEATLTFAAKKLESLGRIVGRSSLYSTAPVGIADQPRFVNAVIALETDFEPRPLLERLMRIEQEVGRDRSAGVRNGPRTLDLDILLFGDERISEPGLEIPHPRLAERIFVIKPLCEIAPSTVHSVSGLTMKQLLHHVAFGKASGDDAAIPIPWGDWTAGAGGASTAPASSGATDPDGDR